MKTRPGLLVPLALLAATLLLPSCRTLRMGRDVPLDLLGREPDDEPEPADGPAEPLAETAPTPDPARTAPPPPPPRAEPEQAKVSDEPGAEDERVAAVQPRSWLTGQQLTSEGASTDARWDADGAQIIFQSVREGGGTANPNPQTWLMDADGSRQRRITMGIGVTQGPGFVAGLGRQVYYASTHHTGETPAAAGALPSDMEVYRQDLDRGGFDQLTDSPGFDGDATWCAGGDLIVFASERAGDLELYALEGGQTRRVTEATGADRAAALSPDCSQLAWIREGALLVAAADGTGEQTLVPFGADAPAWHPDGALLVFSAVPEPDSVAELFTIRADGADLRRLTVSSGAARAPSFSPDGARLLYSWDRTGVAQLFVSPWDASMGSPWTFQTP